MSSIAAVIPKSQDYMQLKQLGYLRKAVVDLRVQAGMQRMLLSESATEIINATLAAQGDDPMVDGKKEKNPFSASQKKCDIL